MSAQPAAAVLSSVVGFSRMGPNRELKKRVETFWKEVGPVGSAQSDSASARFLADIEQLQVQRWQALKATGLDLVPSNDFSLYDQVLDCAFLFGAIPARYRQLEEGKPTVRTYFAMARGLQESGGKVDVPALPMKKWFDTNYHYIVPELQADQQFAVGGANKPLADFQLAKDRLQLVTKPCLVGPISFLHLSHVVGAQSPKEHLKLLPALVPQYVKVIQSLVAAGAKYIQVDEPVFGISLPAEDTAAYHEAFKTVASQLQQAAGDSCPLVFTTYFNSLVSSGHLPIVRALPPGAGIHLDLVRAPDQLEPVLAELPAGCRISLGLVDGRNVWLTPLQAAIDRAAKVIKQLGPGRVLVSSSCSLLHLPYSTGGEKADGQEAAKVLGWLSFGLEKIRDVVLISQCVRGVDVSAAVKANTQLLQEHSKSPLIHSQAVKLRVAELLGAGVHSAYRPSPFHQRVVDQKRALQLPLIPTTTIGSFPQSAEVRQVRAKYKAGTLSEADYQAFVRREIERCVRIQEEIGLDILVHGEFERNDMVEFFADFLRGMLVTANGWVQSYGSRCVKPPIIYGDVSRPSPMTVETIGFAQGLTNKSLKGMLTGPTTILKWSFVRNDQPLRDTTFQLALALRDEVRDLDAAGIRCIQVDEPAFREGLPLDASGHQEYLKTAVEAFKIATGSVQDQTQVHTHMCYSNFEDIFTHIAALDADVLYIEASRSELSLMSCFDRFGYPLNVGPGLYDIHSPRVPGEEELKERLLEMLKYIPASRLFANPDCGLKTRGWPETKAALAVMVKVAAQVREQISGQQK